MLKKIGLVVLVFSFVFVMGAGSANAALTLSSVAVDSAAGDAMTIGASNVAGTIAIGAANTGGITIGNGATAKTIAIGTGAAANAVNLGSINTTSATTIEGGIAAGGINIGNGNTAHGIRIGSGTTGVNTILIGAGAPANVITIGGGAGTLAIDTGDWDISTTGAMTGIGDITSTGNLTNFAAYSTDVDGRSIYGKSTISDGFNTTGPVVGAGVFGRVNGSTPTLTAGTAYLGGTFGYYGITGSINNTHPKGGVIGVIGAVTTSADAAVLALIDGDTGVTTAGAAFGVRYTNSTSGSGFGYGLDLYSAAIGSYLPVSYATADIRLSSGAVIKTGAGVPGATTCNTATAPNGSLYINTSASSASTVLYVCYQAEANGAWTAK